MYHLVATRDIAKLYQVETKRVNEAVKNNLDKFPERFSFVMTKLEKEDLWSKISTANISSKSRSNPRVFTEQGLYMLAAILKSKVATKISIAIMDAFNETTNILRSKISTLNIKQGYNIKYLPFVLTEQGIMMLSSLLKVILP